MLSHVNDCIKGASSRSTGHGIGVLVLDQLSFYIAVAVA